MNKNNEKGFALILSLVLMLAMSLMGGALIVISAGDHSNINTDDDYQQTFYVAETALLEGERYVLNQSIGPWNTSTDKRDLNKRNMPRNTVDFKDGEMNKINYSSKLGNKYYLDTKEMCLESFPDIITDNIKVVTAESWNFGVLLDHSFGNNAPDAEEIENLKRYYYEYFITNIGTAPFRGTGGSVKKGASNSGNDGVAFRIHGCGIKKNGTGIKGKDNLVVALESVLVLPK